MSSEFWKIILHLFLNAILYNKITNFFIHLPFPDLLKTNPKPVQQTVDVSSTKEDGVEIKGLVLEETKTKPGRDFYKLFYNLYTVNNINANKIVKIKEVLALGRNTKIEVLVGEKKVFEFFVRPSIDYLTKVNDQAILRVYKYLKNLEESADIQQRY